MAPVIPVKCRSRRFACLSLLAVFATCRLKACADEAFSTPHSSGSGTPLDGRTVGFLRGSGPQSQGAAPRPRVIVRESAEVSSSIGGKNAETFSVSAVAGNGPQSHGAAPRPRVIVEDSAEVSTSIGGKHAETFSVSAVAGLSVFLMSSLSQFTKKAFGIPLYGPPLAAASLILATQATAAAQKGATLEPADVINSMIQTGTAMGGATFLAVAVAKACSGPPALARALVVATSAMYMTLFPKAAFFPPVAAFCVLYVDQTLINGPLAIGFKYALFPCATGTVILVAACRFFTALLAQPLRKLAATH
eukprot:TRINITY_DN13560_c0_g1_i1.p1 TRINITY_DN13560_c0_g1~~TRINITY_DN13560_c0_g1_i1.p1  ORF type:complete len:323 (-),score=45.92 TRINITY_DN13560_c0_g1_i1:515-1432(-)